MVDLVKRFICICVNRVIVVKLATNSLDKTTRCLKSHEPLSQGLPPGIIFLVKASTEKSWDPVWFEGLLHKSLGLLELNNQTGGLFGTKSMLDAKTWEVPKEFFGTYSTMPLGPHTHSNATPTPSTARCMQLGACGPCKCMHTRGIWVLLSLQLMIFSPF